MTEADAQPAIPAAPSRPRSYRGRHRHLSDEAAHDNGKPFTPPAIIGHPRVCADPPTLIQTPAQLDEAAAYLRAAGIFGYDTEFIGEDSYHPYLCLIQAATAERVLLIDPLKINDLAPWWGLLTDPTLRKIVHAGEQDIEPVCRITGKPAAGVFDTQIAAGLCGLDYPLSLGRIVKQLLDAEHDAGAKFSRWDRRPLTDRQLFYAASDVRYLAALDDWLMHKLNELGNTGFAEQACAELCDPRHYGFDPLARKVKAKGVNKLSRKKRAVFNGVVVWREHLARELNVTPRGLLADQAIYEIADSLPRSADKLPAVKHVPRPLCEQHGGALIDAIEAALNGPYPPKPNPPHYDRDEHRACVNALWDRIAARCNERTINPAAVTSKRELGPLIAAALEDRPIPQLPVNTGWRRELLGEAVADDALLGVLE